MAVRRVTNVKIVLHLHNDLLNKDTFKAKEMVACLSKVITVSNFIKGRVETIGAGIPIETVHNGIDLKRFRSQSPQTAITKKSLGFDDDDFVAVYSGRLTKEKGIKELLEAFLLLKDYPKLKLLIIGGSFYGNDTSSQSPFMAELQKIAEQIQGRVVFTGYVDYDDIPAYLRSADIAVVPSMWEEPFALTCVEALAAGLPLIATQDGGIPESTGDCALFVNKANVVCELKEALYALYTDAARREVMSAQGLSNSKKYDKVRYASDFYQQL